MTVADDAEVMLRHIEALYVHDGRGRITAINQWDGGVVPRFHLGRTSQGNVCRFRQDLPDELAEALARYCEEEPLTTDLKTVPLHQEAYVRLLSEHAPIISTSAGPAYCFADSPASKRASAVVVDARNTHLLEGGMEDWIPDVPHRRPFLAMVEDDHVVSVCASARITNSAHEAGVETLLNYRRKGYAIGVVSAWASAVRDLGAMPLYSTSWGNVASQNLARALGLEAVGTDYRIT